jgi:hypothetical protein
MDVAVMRQNRRGSETERRPPAGPVPTAGVVIYGTLVLLLIAIPQSVVNRLKDLDPGPVQDALLGAAESIEALSVRIGANAPYRRLRQLFLDVTGKNDD